MKFVKYKGKKVKIAYLKRNMNRVPRPLQYDEYGLLLNPTEEQLYKKLKSAEDEYWVEVKAGRKMRNITCLADILNDEEYLNS